MSKRKKPAQRTETARLATNTQNHASVDLNEAERRGGVTGKGFVPGVSGNPGGVSKEKRAFLERLKADDPDTIYEAFMQGVRDGVPPIVIRAVEYLAGKPKESVELSGELKAAIEHDVKADVIQSPDRQRSIVSVLERAGQLPAGTTAALDAVLSRSGGQPHAEGSEGFEGAVEVAKPIEGA